MFPQCTDFTIDSSGDERWKLLELAGYNLVVLYSCSRCGLIRPPGHDTFNILSRGPKCPADPIELDTKFTDFITGNSVMTFLFLDLSPTFAALIAPPIPRIMSTLARLKDFSLVSRQVVNTISPPSHGGTWKTEIRSCSQISSFEKWINTLDSADASMTRGRPEGVRARPRRIVILTTRTTWNQGGMEGEGERTRED